MKDKKDQQNKTPPVQEGQELEVIVRHIGEKGDGIVKVKGFVVFVPKVKENEKVRIKITKVLKNVGFAEVIERIKEKIAEPPKALDMPKASDSFGEELEEDDELAEFEALVKE